MHYYESLEKIPVLTYNKIILNLKMFLHAGSYDYLTFCERKSRRKWQKKRKKGGKIVFSLIQA